MGKNKISSPIAMTISAIMSFVLGALMMSHAARIFYLLAITDPKDPGGVLGIIMALLFVFSGVIAICLRNYEGEEVPLICFALCLVSAFLNYCVNTSWKDLDIWMAVIFIYAFVYFGIAVKYRLSYNKLVRDKDD